MTRALILLLALSACAPQPEPVSPSFDWEALSAIEPGEG